MISRFRIAAILAAVTLFLASGQARAAVLVLELSDVYTGTSPVVVPGVSPPWLTATFVDNVDGTVGLTLAANLSGVEHFKVIGFNYNGPTPLVAEAVPANMNITFHLGSPPSLNGGAEPFKVDGNFFFGFDLNDSNSDGGINRFNGTDVITLVLSSTMGDVDVSMFNFSTEGFFAAAHVGGIGTNDASGKIGDTDGDPNNPPEAGPTTPEPASLALLALGSIGLGGFRLRRRKANAA